MKCGTCKVNEEKNKKKNICASCYAKEWRKKNPDKIKAYLKRKEEHIKNHREEYYKNNRKILLKNQRIRRKRTNYDEDKTKKRREETAIRRATREKYPLKNQKCVKCGEKAENRHHTTEPKEVDKFIFLCKTCHLKIHGQRNFTIQEEKEGNYQDYLY